MLGILSANKVKPAALGDLLRMCQTNWLLGRSRIPLDLYAGGQLDWLSPSKYWRWNSNDHTMKDRTLGRTASASGIRMGRQGRGCGLHGSPASAETQVCFPQQDFSHSLLHLSENAMWSGLGLNVLSVDSYA